MIEPKEDKRYIILNNYIRDAIKKFHKDNKINGVLFSKEVLGLSPSYLSHMEKGTIKKVDVEILKILFGSTLKLSNEELETYLSDLIEESLKHEDSNELIPNKSNEIDFFTTGIDKDNIEKYIKSPKKNIINRSKLIDPYLKMFSEIFEKWYKKNPDSTFGDLLLIYDNMQFDSGFMVSIMTHPYNVMENITRSKRKMFLDDVENLIYRYSDGESNLVKNTSQEEL